MPLLRERNHGGGQEMPPLRNVAGLDHVRPSLPGKQGQARMRGRLQAQGRRPHGILPMLLRRHLHPAFRRLLGQDQPETVLVVVPLQPVCHARLELLLPAYLCNRRSSPCRHIPFPVHHDGFGHSAVVRYNPETPRRRKGLGMDIHQLCPFYRRLLAVSHPMSTRHNKMPKDTFQKD